MNTAIVTGATGFIGSHLVSGLVQKGWKVHIVVRSQSDLRLLKSVKENIVVHCHDGTTESMISIVRDSNPHCVFHIASNILTNHTASDIIPIIQSNILFSTQLVEAMITNNIYSFINTGTYWQHYENKDYSPVCLYAATKQAFKDILQFYVESTPLKAITLKLFDTYGPNDPRPKLFHLLRKSIDTKEHLNMSPGEQLIDIVYIDDVIEAYIIAANRLLNDIGNKSEEFVITSGRPIPLRELVNIYSQIVKKKADVIWGGRNYRNREVMIPWTKGKVLPNWRPRFTTEQGIKAMEGI